MGCSSLWVLGKGRDGKIVWKRFNDVYKTNDMPDLCGLQYC